MDDRNWTSRGGIPTSVLPGNEVRDGVGCQGEDIATLRLPSSLTRPPETGEHASGDFK